MRFTEYANIRIFGFPYVWNAFMTESIHVLYVCDASSARSQLGEGRMYD